MLLLLIVAAGLLAFANGANDTFKGFATVWGSRTLTYKRALGIATAAALAGAAVSILMANGLAHRFSGKGLVPDAVAGDPAFMLAAGAGAAAAVLSATRLGFPVSTTHALIGGLLGAALGVGGAIDLTALGGVFLVPLLASPLVSAALGFCAHALLSRRPRERACVCIAATPASAGPDAALARSSLVIASDRECNALASHARLSVATALDRVHVASAATVCFARSVNDTPKLAALLIAANAFEPRAAAVAIAALMGLGGIVFGRRVAETMSRRIAQIDPERGLAANVVTAGLVLCTSNLGLPVSTTHVSVGSIAGASLAARTLNWATLRGVLLSWLATLPAAAAFAWAIASAGWN